MWSNLEVVNEGSPTSIVWASQGPEGSGKSAFGLSAPGPIYVAAFDPYGIDRVDKKFKAGKNIRIARYAFNPNKYDDKAACKKAAAEVWKRFVGDYTDALAHVRTALWDREDMANKLQRYSSWGDTSAAPSDYEDLYIDYIALIQEAFKARVNLGLLRGLKEKWVSKFDAGKGKMVGHNTGEMIPGGMKGLPDHVDITLSHRWDDTQNLFMTKLVKFTNPEFRGQEFPNLDFATMAMSAYPETPVEAWI